MARLYDVIKPFNVICEYGQKYRKYLLCCLKFTFGLCVDSKTKKYIDGNYMIKAQNNAVTYVFTDTTKIQSCCSQSYLYKHCSMKCLQISFQPLKQLHITKLILIRCTIEIDVYVLILYSHDIHRSVTVPKVISGLFNPLYFVD